MLLRLEFLTSFGEFNFRYPTEGELPFQKLPTKSLGMWFPGTVESAYGSSNTEYLSVTWRGHKGTWREQRWVATHHHLKRRGHMLSTRVAKPRKAPFVIVCKIVAWHTADLANGLQELKAGRL